MALAGVLPKAGNVTLMRPLAGGSLELYMGHVSTPGAGGQNIRQLSARPSARYAEAYAMVFLVESGFAQQTDVARAFARSVRTVRRYQGRRSSGHGEAVGSALATCTRCFCFCDLPIGQSTISFRLRSWRVCSEESPRCR
jgi:hypothetical protein